MFDAGAAVSGLLTGLREGVEAALLVAIICAALARSGGTRHLPRIAVGVAAAAVVSAVLGFAIFAAAGELQAPYEQLFEAGAMLLAAAVVTWMLFWMRRQAAGLGGDLREAVARALTAGTAWAFAALAFTAVIREGLETALFLAGQATAAGAAGGAGPRSVLVGALAGLALATAFGYAFYRGSRLLDLQRFFRWTGVLLVFIAAGLLASAIHELVEIGWIAAGAAVAFDLGAVLPHDSGIGLVLRTLFGYTSSPEWIALAVWAAYVGIVLTLYLRPLPSARRPAATERLGEAGRPAATPGA